MKRLALVLLLLVPIAVSASYPPKHGGTRAATFYLCPNDDAILGVKNAAPSAEYKCPVDGATMQRTRGGSAYFYADR